MPNCLKFKKALSQVKMEIEELPGLVQGLGELQATGILKRNYDLKMARQDYFTSKLDQVGFTDQEFVLLQITCSNKSKR